MFHCSVSLNEYIMGFSRTLNHLALSILWWSLHVVLSAYICICNLLSRILAAVNPIYYLNSRRFISIAARDLHTLSKVPVHIGIVFSGNPRDFSTRNLVDLISWCTAFRIAFITVYDTQGFWRSKRCEIRREMETELEKRFRVNVDNHHVCEKACDGDVTISATSPSDLSSISGPVITFLAEIDGKHSIVNSAKELCYDVKAKRVALHQVDQDLMDFYIRKNLPVVDPDLVLKIGEMDSLLGYLPWHIRLTEIRYMPHADRVTFQEFRDALYRFSRVEQRFGR